MHPTSDTTNLLDIAAEQKGKTFSKPTLAITAAVYAFTTLGVFVTMKKLVQVVGKLK